MFKYHNLQERFGSKFCFNDGDGSGSGGDGGQGGQDKTGQIDYNKILNDPKFQETLVGSEFYKKNIQSAEDKIRTKYTGEKKTIEQQMAAMADEMAILKNERLENIKTSVIEEVGIPLKFRSRITGATKEEMIESAKALKADIDELINASVDERLKGIGTDPKKDRKEPIIKNDLKNIFRKV
ncbi:MAG: capsid assembly scaffolding protein Gp46 family protein [Fusobacteriaceae bacterium]